ncbi:hypothetical protein [uncultured Erythrobacter sp.]|uniref:hypothetical protein n=1 Tax=uncultured Erythrobacter sp. TaxID=263913 RepID=UPI00262DFE07|nr:hypothetical protein [uncultured Erythrobacter sp.]
MRALKYPFALSLCALLTVFLAERVVAQKSVTPQLVFCNLFDSSVEKIEPGMAVRQLWILNDSTGTLRTKDFGDLMGGNKFVRWLEIEPGVIGFVTDGGSSEAYILTTDGQPVPEGEPPINSTLSTPTGETYTGLCNVAVGAVAVEYFDKGPSEQPK